MDDPPYLSVGTEVSAKYKGAFCEAKVRKVVRNIKCKVAYKQGLGTGTVSDDQIKGDILRVGAVVEVKHPDRRDFVEATITKIQDCSQYTVVFDDGDITTLRRSALCLKSGRHFNESETLDQLPLTHPEHFGNPVIGGRRGRSCRSRQLQDDSSDDDDEQDPKEIAIEKEEHIGKVVCVESTDTKKKGPKENWFPALVVSPTTQDTVRIRVKEEYLVRSFKDGRYYTVPKKEATEFTREMSHKQDGQAIQAALEYLDNDVLPPHWDRDALFGLGQSSSDFDQEFDSDSSDDEPREEKDHFVAQLYKYMDDRGTPLNKGPSIVNRDVDLYRLFRAVDKLGGYNRVTGQNQWKSIAIRLGFTPATTSITNLVKQAYKKFLQPFEEFNRKLGCTMVAYPRANRIKGRSLVRANSVASPKPVEQTKEPIVEKQTKQQTSTLAVATAPVAVPAAADESENNSEPETKHTSLSSTLAASKRKLSTGNTTNTGKVKALVDKFDAKSTVDRESKEQPEPVAAPMSTPAAVVDIVLPTTPTSSRTPVSKISSQKLEESRTPIAPSQISTPPTAVTVITTPTAIKKEKEPKEPKVVEVVKETIKEKSMTSATSSEKSSSSSSSKSSDKNNDKRGRKKKDNDQTPDKFEKSEKTQEKVREEKKESSNLLSESTTSSNDFPIEVGDKLKVYYHEQKVTYEAKVIEISDQGTPLYLVHYTGWNTRYDEWVPKERIAENLSNNKIKRTKSNASRSSNSNVGSTTPTSNPNKSSAKRGRGGSRSDSQPPRSTTPSSVASNSSRTKSPATPAQRRTTRGQPNSMRRTSNNTDISSVQTESDTDSDEPVKKPLSRLSTNNSASKLNSQSTPVSSSPSGTTAPSLHIGANSRSSSSQDEESFSSAAKGRDYDLNQIRSELKGFKEIKSPSPDVERLLITKIEPDIKPEMPNEKLLSAKELSSQTSSLPKGTISSSSDTKNTSSDISSDSESLGGDDDSQSSLDKTIATVKNEAKFGTKTDSKVGIVQQSSLTGKNLSVFSSIIEKQPPVHKEIMKPLLHESERDTKPVIDDSEKPADDSSSSSSTITNNIIKSSIFSGKLSEAITTQKPNIDKVQSTVIKAEKPSTPLKSEKKIIMSEKLNRDKLMKASTTEKLASNSLSSSLQQQQQSSSDNSKTQQPPIVCDIYEFKEPEPFEYETTTTPSKKQPIVIDSSSVGGGSNLSSSEKRGGGTGSSSKVLGVKTEKITELKTNLNTTTSTPIAVPIPSITGGKRKKNSPNKELDFKSFKQIKKEEVLGSPTDEYGSTPSKTNSSTSSSSSIESTFDVLRKSPSFNMRGGIGNNPGECSTLPQITPAIDALNSQIKSNFFNSGCSNMDFEPTKPKAEKKLFNDMLCDVPSTSTSIPVKQEESILKEAMLSSDTDVDSPIHGKDFERVKELLTVETFADLEPPKIEKIPSIADRVLKALNQQSSGVHVKTEIKSGDRILSPTPILPTSITASSISSFTSITLPIKLQPATILASEIVKPTIIESLATSKSLEVPLISIDTYPKKSLTTNPISVFAAANMVGSNNSTDILESISPKNNDLSETIQKLESAIKKTIPTSVQPVNIDRFNDDSSESTDSEQRLIIEDESLSSETQGILTTNSSTGGCSVSNQPMQSTQPTHQQEHVIESENSFASIKFNHQEGAISIFSSTQSTVIHSQLDKQQMTAVECLTTGMIDRENERLSLLHSAAAANNQDSILNQAHHINPGQITLIKKEESQHNTHSSSTTNTFLQEQSQQNESLSMLLCEETIPGSPAPVCTNTSVVTVEATNKKPYDSQTYITQNPHPTSSDIKPVPMEIENDLIGAAAAAVAAAASAKPLLEIKSEQPPPSVANSEINISNTMPSIVGDPSNYSNANNNNINNNNNNSGSSSSSSGNNNSKHQISAQTSVSINSNINNSGQGVSSSIPPIIGGAVNSPRDSISPEDSKSEGESDIKKREHEMNDISRIVSPKKRRRQRKSSELVDSTSAHNNNHHHNNNNNSNVNVNVSHPDHVNENINTNNSNNNSNHNSSGTHHTTNNNHNSSNTNNSSSSKRRKIPHARKHTNGSDSEDNNFDVSALHHRTQRRSPKPCQYNFLVEFDVTLTSAQKINIIKKKIQEVRKTYNMVKAELASIDRRRKKLRRREREKNKLAKASAS